jgi:hypothetical protein
MSKHACPRCGLESKQDAWHDRHPVAAVLLALPTLYTLTGVILAYPWFFVPVLVIVCALLVNRAGRRRAAIAARADHEHRQMMAAAVFRRSLDFSRLTLKSTRTLNPSLSPRHVMNRWPTTPIPTGRIPR